MSEKKSYGLVLSGGGAKGAFEMGVWKAIHEANLSLGAVIGTSVGALNAAMIAQNNYETAINFWSHVTVNQVLDLSKSMTKKYVGEWEQESFDVFRSGFLRDLFDGGLDLTPLRKNLESLISEDAIRKSPIRFGLVTVDLTSLKPKELMIEDIPKGKLIDYLLASSALPIFQKQEIDGKTYIDGGFFDNTPINFMSKIGFKDIISVEFPAPGFRQFIKEKKLNITTVQNSEFLGGILDFDKEAIQHSIKLGYLDGLKAFDQLKGKHFFIDFRSTPWIYPKFEKVTGNQLSNPLQEQKLKLLLGEEAAYFHDQRLKNLEGLLGLTLFRKSPLPLSILEITGKNLGVPRLEVYTADSFFQKILEEFQRLLDENLTLLEDTRILEDFFLPSSNNFRKYNFITFYIVFASVQGNQSSSKMLALISRFTPEVILSIATLFYIHEMLKS